MANLSGSYFSSSSLSEEEEMCARRTITFLSALLFGVRLRLPRGNVVDRERILQATVLGDCILSVCVCGRTREGLRDGGHFPGERQAEDQVDQQRHAGFEDPEVEEPFVRPENAV